MAGVGDVLGRAVDEPAQVDMALIRIPAFALLLLSLVFSAPTVAQAQTNSPLFSARSLFEAVGGAVGVDPELLEAIAVVESGGRANAVSPKGATGLMQLMPDTARRFGVKHPFNPVENVIGAARFLSYLREYAGIGDLPLLLAAYNAGEGAVGHYGGLPPYPETREYVRRVLLTYLLGDGSSPVQGSSVNSYWLTRSPARQRIQRPLIQQTSMPRWTETTKPKTEADVFAQLEQIKTARTRALKLQAPLRQKP